MLYIQVMHFRHETVCWYEYKLQHNMMPDQNDEQFNMMSDQNDEQVGKHSMPF